MDWFIVKFMPIAIYALLGFGAGALLLWRQLKKSRSPKVGQPALLAWHARVTTGFREEPFLVTTLILHDFLLLPMAVLCFVTAIRGQGKLPYRSPR